MSHCFACRKWSGPRCNPAQHVLPTKAHTEQLKNSTDAATSFTKISAQAQVSDTYDKHVQQPTTSDGLSFNAMGWDHDAGCFSRPKHTPEAAQTGLGELASMPSQLAGNTRRKVKVSAAQNQAAANIPCGSATLLYDRNIFPTYADSEEYLCGEGPIVQDKRLEVVQDDVARVQRHRHHHAKQLFDVVTSQTVLPSPADSTAARKARFTRTQHNTQKAVNKILKATDGVRYATARVQMVIQEAEKLHLKGVPVNLLKQDETDTTLSGYLVDLTSKLSQRLLDINEAAKNKLVVKDILNGTNIKDLVRAPEAYARRKITNYKSNSVKGEALEEVAAQKKREVAEIDEDASAEAGAEHEASSETAVDAGLTRAAKDAGEDSAQDLGDQHLFGVKEKGRKRKSDHESAPAGPAKRTKRTKTDYAEPPYTTHTQPAAHPCASQTSRQPGQRGRMDMPFGYTMGPLGSSFGPELGEQQMANANSSLGREDGNETDEAGDKHYTYGGSNDGDAEYETDDEHAETTIDYS